MTRNLYSNLFIAKTRGKENVDFCAAVEEVNSGKAQYTELHKHSVQGFDSICVELKHQLKTSRSPAASCRDPPLRCWHNTHEQNVGEWPGVTFTTVYYYNWEKHIHITTFKYKAQILSIDTISFCFEKWF